MPRLSNCGGAPRIFDSLLSSDLFFHVGTEGLYDYILNYVGRVILHVQELVHVLVSYMRGSIADGNVSEVYDHVFGSSLRITATLRSRLLAVSFVEDGLLILFHLLRSIFAIEILSFVFVSVHGSSIGKASMQVVDPVEGARGLLQLRRSAS